LIISEQGVQLRSPGGNARKKSPPKLSQPSVKIFNVSPNRCDDLNLFSLCASFPGSKSVPTLDESGNSRNHGQTGGYFAFSHFPSIAFFASWLFEESHIEKTPFAKGDQYFGDVWPNAQPAVRPSQTWEVVSVRSRV